MTVYLVISLPKIPYTHHRYNIYGSGQPCPYGHHSHMHTPTHTHPISSSSRIINWSKTAHKGPLPFWVRLFPCANKMHVATSAMSRHTHTEHTHTRNTHTRKYIVKYTEVMQSCNCNCNPFELSFACTAGCAASQRPPHSNRSTCRTVCGHRCALCLWGKWATPTCARCGK